MCLRHDRVWLLLAQETRFEQSSVEILGASYRRQEPWAQLVASCAEQGLYSNLITSAWA
jgi:hypothetical protein